MLPMIHRRDFTSAKPLTIVNETSSNRTKLCNKTTAVNDRNIIVLVNGIVSGATSSKTDLNHYVTTQDGFSADKHVSDNSTYHGTFPSDSVDDV